MPILATPVVTAVEMCADGIDPRLSVSLVRQESNFNPYAIGLDGKAVLKAQPKTYEEAVRTAVNLMREGRSFSVGLAQVHISNVVRYGMTWQEAFDPCANVRAGSKILKGFYARAVQAGYRENDAVFAALRGFNSGSVHNPVSNGYARDILGRLTNVPSVAAMPVTAVPAAVVRVEGMPSPVQPAARDARRAEPDNSSPDMFAAPSRSLFTGTESERRGEQTAQPAEPNPAPLMVSAFAGTAPTDAARADDRPVQVQAQASAMP